MILPVTLVIIAPIDLSLVFEGWGPFPAVRGVNNQTGAWDHPGPTRKPDLSDRRIDSDQIGRAHV